MTGNKIDPVEIENTFYHEVLHLCLDKLGHYELAKDEKLVCQLSNAIRQVINTRTF